MNGMWWTGSEITRVYAVTERKLNVFWRRGDLARRRDADNEIRYPVEDIHELFPRRGCASLDDRTETSMAVLGTTSLGVVAAEAAPVKLLSRPPHPSPSRRPTPSHRPRRAAHA